MNSIITGKFSVQIRDKKDSFLISYIDLVLHLFESHISFFNGYNIKPLLNIKEFKIISKSHEEIRIKEIKTKKEYIIDIHELYTETILPISFKKIHSNNKLRISEENVKQNVINNINKYIEEDLENVNTEYSIDDGRIDILGLDKKGIYHILELKKKETDFNTIDQVLRYGNFFEDLGIEYRMYVLGINNNGKNKEYANKNNVKILTYKE